MNDKPKEKVYAERLDSSKKSGKDYERSNPRPQKENPKTKENKNSNLRKKRIYFNIFLQMPNENKRVVTKILSSPVFIKNSH